MEIKDDFKSLFAENGFSSFDSFMNFTGGDTLKRITVRSIVKFDLPQDGDNGKEFYLKRHTQRVALKDKAGSAISGGALSEAGREWEAIEALMRAGVPAVKGVAYGERFPTALTQESFLVTEGLTGFTQLEALVHDFAPPLDKEGLKKKRLLIRRVAELVKLLHGEGFNHRDLYLTHILAKVIDGGDYELRLIDLQRVEHRHRFRARWIVKDISALNYSSPRGLFTNTDRMRFYKLYLGKDYNEKLAAGERAFVKKVLAKTSRIADHTVKMYKKRAERKARGELER